MILWWCCSRLKPPSNPVTYMAGVDFIVGLPSGRVRLVDSCIRQCSTFTPIAREKETGSWCYVLWHVKLPRRVSCSLEVCRFIHGGMFNFERHPAEHALIGPLPSWSIESSSPSCALTARTGILGTSRLTFQVFAAQRCSVRSGVGGDRSV